MTLRYGPAFLAAAFVLSCSHTPQAVSAGYIGDGDYAPAPAVMGTALGTCARYARRSCLPLYEARQRQ
ncbi:MAG: hypothetical protein IJM59_01460 [Proteobacteria bacterium]|nr:hypothetical protein [Pseudomonadota bacterium]